MLHRLDHNSIFCFTVLGKYCFCVIVGFNYR